MSSSGVLSVVHDFVSEVIGIDSSAVAQEVLLLSIFLLSFFGLRYLNLEQRKARRRPKVVESEEFRTDEVQESKKLPRSCRSEVDTSAIEAQLLKCLSGQQFTKALNLYRSLERDGHELHFSEELYSSFIQSAIRVGKVDVIERMLRAMRRTRKPPSLKFWQTILKMLSSRKNYSVCVAVFQHFGRDLPIDKVIYSCMINAALEVGMADKAVAMLPRYSQCGIADKDYVLFFRTYVAVGDVDAAEVIFRQLGPGNTPLMLNHLLLICVNINQVERGFGLLQQAHDLESSDDRIVDVVSYNTIIKGFAAAKKLQNCMECLQLMLRKSIQPDEITLGTLLEACVQDQDSKTAFDLFRLLMGASENAPPVMDAGMCSVFFRGLVRAGCLRHALHLYEEMKRWSVVKPDLVCYSVLIKALVDQHELARALELVEDLKANGEVPDDIIVTHLLEGCRFANNHSLGKKFFKEMLENGVRPSEYTLVTLLKLHGRCGFHKEAYDQVAAWERDHGWAPSVIHYTCLMSGCIRSKQHDQAWAAYQLMQAKGIQPDSTTLSVLLQGMISAHMWNRVLAIAEANYEAKSSHDLGEPLNLALGLMLQTPNLRPRAVQLQEMMTAAGVSISLKNMKFFV